MQDAEKLLFMDHKQDTSATIATCYLREAGNEQHKTWLSQDHLYLLYKGQLKIFALEEVNQITFNHRKLMFPLVIGGVAACLSLVAIFKLYYNPWIMLSLLTAGCLAAYRGYQGSWVLTIEEQKTHTDFFLDGISPNLRAFVRYANTFTGRKPKGILYLPLSTKEWEKAQAEGFFQVREPLRLYFGRQTALAPSDKPAFIAVNTLEDHVHTSWKKDPDSQELHPFVEPGSHIPLHPSPLS